MFLTAAAKFPRGAGNWVGALGKKGGVFLAARSALYTVTVEPRAHLALPTWRLAPRCPCFEAPK